GVRACVVALVEVAVVAVAPDAGRVGGVRRVDLVHGRLRVGALQDGRVLLGRCDPGTFLGGRLLDRRLVGGVGGRVGGVVRGYAAGAAVAADAGRGGVVAWADLLGRAEAFGDLPDVAGLGADLEAAAAATSARPVFLGQGLGDRGGVPRVGVRACVVA